MNYSLDTSKNIISDAGELSEDSMHILEDAIKIVEDAQDAIQKIDLLSINYETGEGPKLEMAVAEAQNILNSLKKYSLTDLEAETSNQLDKVNDLFATFKTFKGPVESIDEEVEDFNNRTNALNERLADLYSQSQYALKNMKEADYDKHK